VTSTHYASAVAHAQEAVEDQFGTTSTCTSASPTRWNCTLSGLPYTFSIITPVPAGGCATCDPARSVQVNVSHPTFKPAFARMLGQSTWNIRVSAVAGLQHAPSYAVVTLRPPKSEALPGVRDIAINGGTTVEVQSGDVATNANMTYSGSGSILRLDAGYSVYYFDPAHSPLWGVDPPAVKITELVTDPGYAVPERGTTPPAGAQSDEATCRPIAETVYANPNYAPSVPVAGGTPDMSKIQCYTPGVYVSLAVSNGNLAILTPGLYFFDGLLDVQGSLIGGYTPASEGVALVFRESQGTEFKNRTSGGSSSLAQIVALNAGDRFGNPAGTEATAARDYNGGLVQTSTTPPRLMTIIVPPDPLCPVVLPFPATCAMGAENVNKAIDLSGGSGVYLAGVQYAPTDNVTIAGNAATGGYVGQVWAWTLAYTGGSVIKQEGEEQSQGGTLRLDAACTAPGTPCIP
jgi:hypothetical protein